MKRNQMIKNSPIVPQKSHSGIICDSKQRWNRAKIKTTAVLLQKVLATIRPSTCQMGIGAS